MMNTIESIAEEFGLDAVDTGGNCQALSTDLNTNQDQIVITGNDCELPTDESESFTVAVYLDGEHGDPAHIREVTGIDTLDFIVRGAFMRWGN